MAYTKLVTRLRPEKRLPLFRRYFFLLPAAVLSFVLFRIFDIWKPSIIGKVDREVKGGLGVMGDDLLAGFFAGLLGLMLIGVMQKLESLEPLLGFHFGF